MDEELLKAIYDNEGFESRGVSFDEFVKDMESSPELRQAVHENSGFGDKGIDFNTFESDLGIKPLEQESNRLTFDTTDVDTSIPELDAEQKQDSLQDDRTAFTRLIDKSGLDDINFAGIGSRVTSGINAIDRGWEMAVSAGIIGSKDIDELDDEDLKRLAEAQRQIKQFKQSDSAESILGSETGSDLKSNIGEEGFINTVGSLLESTIESAVSLGVSGFKEIFIGQGIKGVTKKVAGKLLPYAGQAAALVGLGKAAYDVEYSSEIMGALQSRGVDVTNEEALKRAFNDESLVEEIANRANDKSLPTAVTEAVGMAVLGRFGASRKVRNTFMRALGRGKGKVALGAAVVAGEGVTGVTGAALGSSAIGEELGAGEAFAEFFGEGVTGGVTTGVQAFTDRATFEGDIADAVIAGNKERVLQEIDLELSAGVINEETATELKSIADDIEEINNSIPEEVKGAKKRKKVIELIKERKAISEKEIDPAFEDKKKAEIDSKNEEIKKAASVKEPAAVTPKSASGIATDDTISSKDNTDNGGPGGKTGSPTPTNVAEPSQKRQIQDLREGNTTTFIYNSVEEVPSVFKDKITSITEYTDKKGNKKTQVRVTMAKSKADFLLNQLDAEQKQQEKKTIQKETSEDTKEQPQTTEKEDAPTEAPPLLKNGTEVTREDRNGKERTYVYSEEKNGWTHKDSGRKVSNKKAQENLSNIFKENNKPPEAPTGTISEDTTPSTIVEKKVPQNEDKAPSEGNKSVFKEDTTIFRGLEGKKDAKGNKINNHPNVKFPFAAANKKIANQYKGDKDLLEIDIPKGTTVETVKVPLGNKGMGDFRAREEKAINASDAQVVQLETIDASGNETQLVIKDLSLINKEGETPNLSETPQDADTVIKRLQNIAKQNAKENKNPNTKFSKDEIQEDIDEGLSIDEIADKRIFGVERPNKTDKGLTNQVKKFFNLRGEKSKAAKAGVEILKLVDRNLSNVRSKIGAIGATSTKAAEQVAKSQGSDVKLSFSKEISLEEAVDKINNQVDRTRGLIRNARKDFSKATSQKERTSIKKYEKELQQRVKALKELNKNVKKSSDGGINRAAIIRLADGSNLITALEAPNEFSFVHEVFHLFEDRLTRPQRNTLIKAYNEAFPDSQKKPVTDRNKNSYDTDVSEYAARLWENFFAEGRQLTEKDVKNKTLREKLQEIFDTFTEFVQNVAKVFTNSEGATAEVKLSDPVRSLFQEILGAKNKDKKTKVSKNGTKINNEAFDTMMKELGFTEGVSAFDEVATTHRQQFELAEQFGYLHAGEATRIVYDVMVNDKRVSEPEMLALAIHAIKARKTRDLMQSALDKALVDKDKKGSTITDNNIRQQQALLDKMDQDIYNMMEAYRTIGRDAARTLQLRSALLKDTIFSEKYALDRAERLKGSKLTAKEKASVKKAHKELVKSENQVADLEKALEGQATKKLFVEVKREINRISKTKIDNLPDIEESVKKISNLIKNQKDIKFSSDSVPPVSNTMAYRSYIKDIAYFLIKQGVTDIGTIVSEIQALVPEAKSNTIQMSIIMGSPQAIPRVKSDLQKAQQDLRRRHKILQNVERLVDQATKGKPLDAKRLGAIGKEVSKLFKPLLMDRVPTVQYSQMAETVNEMMSTLNRQPLTAEDMKKVRQEILNIKDAARVKNIDRQLIKLQDKIDALSGPNPDLSVLGPSNIGIDVNFVSKELQNKIAERAKKKEQLKTLENNIARKAKIEKGYPSLGRFAKLPAAKALKKGELLAREEGWEVFRTMKAMLDMSMVFNQAGGIILNAQNWRKLPGQKESLAVTAMKTAFTTFQRSKDNTLALKLYNEIKTSEYAPLMEIAGLDIINPDSPYESEEWFSSQLIERLYGVGAVKRASERSFTSFMNVTRARLFENFVKANDELLYNQEALAEVGDMINAMTGRGKTKTFTGKRANISSFGPFIFAPRYYWSKVRTLGNMMTGGVLVKDPFARKIFRQQMGGFAVSFASLMALAGLAGADFEWDPKKKDILRWKFGDTSFDLTAGYGQWIRLMTNLYAATTNRNDIDGEDKPSNDFFNNNNTSTDVVTSFLKYKVHPALSAVWLFADGKDAIGRPIGDTASKRFLTGFMQTLAPISLTQIYEDVVPPASTQDKVAGFESLVDPKLLGKFTLSWFGASVVDYDNKAKDKKVYDYLDSLDARLPRSTTPNLKEDYKWLESEYWKYYFKKDFQDLLGQWVLKELEGGRKPTTKQINTKAKSIRSKLARDFESKYTERLNRSSSLVDKIKG